MLDTLSQFITEIALAADKLLDLRSLFTSHLFELLAHLGRVTRFASESFLPLAHLSKFGFEIRKMTFPFAEVRRHLANRSVHFLERGHNRSVDVRLPPRLTARMKNMLEP